MKKKIDIISGTETAYTMTESERLDYEELKDFYKEQREQTDRKKIPLFSGVIKYFPDALVEVAKTSWMGNQQHHPDKTLHWDRSKSTDELDALTRHLFQSGTIDVDGIKHSAKVAWRALANLQKELEEEGKAPLSEYNKYNNGNI